MNLKQIWSKANDWFGLQKQDESTKGKLGAENDSASLQDYPTTKKQDAVKIAAEIKGPEEETTGKQPAESKAIDNLEFAGKLQSNLNRLVEKTGEINDSLNSQIARHRELMNHLDRLPDLIKNFMIVVERQERSRAHLSEQINTILTRDEQFLEAMEQIPEEKARQTELLTEIKKKLSLSIETDAKMTEYFRLFNETLMKLDADTANQAHSILQMSKTFAISDTYLKNSMGKLSSRFIWLFIISLGVCVISVLVLAGVVVYLVGQ